MKPNSQDLYHLVKSLTKSEKRYFHQLSRSHQGVVPKYYLVFEKLDKMPVWEADFFDKQFEEESFYPHLPVIKHQLFERITDALHLYNRKNSLEENIKKWIQQAYLLLKKELPAQALRLHQKATKQIDRHKLWDLWPELMTQKRLLYERGLITKTPQQWKEDYLEGLNTLANRAKISALKTNLTQQHLRKVNIDASEMQEWSSALATQSLPDCPQTKVDWLQSKALLAFLQGQTDIARATNQQLLSQLEKMPPQQRGIPEKYMSTLYNYLIDQLQSENEEAFYEGLEKLQSLAQKKGFKNIPGVEAKIFEWSNLLLLNARIRKRQYTEAFGRLPNIQTGLRKHQKQLKPQAKATLRLLCGLVAFHHNEPDRALDFVSPLHFENRPSVVLDIYRYATFLFILCHFELGHFQLLEHLVSTQKRRQRNNDAVTAHEIDFIKKMETLAQDLTPNARRQFFKDWNTELVDSAHPLNRYLDLAFWTLRNMER